jgi:hypothetical protein
MSLKIFADHHHGGLGRSLFLLLHERLGHEVWFPDHSFTQWASTKVGAGVWLPVTDDHYQSLQGIPERYLENFPFSLGREQFLNTPWDAVIVSRCESMPLFLELLRDHPKKDIKIIAQAGNEKTEYDWDWAKNFLSSDYGSFVRSSCGNKIFYAQELGQQFQSAEFQPVKAEDLCTVATFTNCLASFNSWRWDKDAWHWDNKCPHCRTPKPLLGENFSVYGTWKAVKSALPGHQFKDYGIDNSFGMLSEKDMPAAYLGASCGFYYKTYEGYGHSLLQSISLGRVALVPRNFFRYRSAGQYLIPFRTCLETDYSAESIAECVKEFTSDLDRVNEMSLACWRAARGLFDWEYEAGRVSKFLSDLR